LFTAISFALLITTAATHHHATAVDDQDCAVCSVVTHKISGTPLVALTHLVVILLSYAPFLFALPASAPVSFRLLPPSCGPPALAPAIC